MATEKSQMEFGVLDQVLMLRDLVEREVGALENSMDEVATGEHLLGP